MPMPRLVAYAIFTRFAVTRRTFLERDGVEQWEFEPVQYRGQVISRRAAARLVFRVE